MSNSNFPIVRIMRADDWVGVYKDGVLIQEGHSFDFEDVVGELFPGLDIKTIWAEDYLYENGRCPAYWSDDFENTGEDDE